jgi:hypothetical protein
MSEHWTYPHQPNAPWNEDEEDDDLEDDTPMHHTDILKVAEHLVAVGVQLPPQLRIGPAGLGFWNLTEQNKDKLRILPDSLAKCILGYAMLVDGKIRRGRGNLVTGDWWDCFSSDLGMYSLADEHHGGDSFASLYAAWKSTRGIDG